tara:strand:+ start:415 stop:618 length:204 start_codon:yes stop_codon:yes gene_type:complete
MSKLERPTEGELYIAYQLGKENKEAYAKEQVIKELEKLGAELYKKEGTDSYVLRCLIHDKKEELKQK